ncbi:interferon omega-1 [Tupaia chinensis]|uniref:Interferon omega-1 n=1 Tax=Tupaia chinensis TaxID=246437 RepID=L8Y906_TUPCH|nr:interferon omega-1 [Tupaia chinensis]XP_006164239.1 interferon omega-1 [Tupaia chinensis]ELV12737.1 Interferon omega-1 [Tupaia chinensis]ELV12738.1 Interferon omega-1 [Tupaia chinensis]
MALSVSSLMVMVMVFSGPIGSLSCDLPQSLDSGKQETLTALAQMGTISFLSCLKDRTDFKFPQEQLDGRQLQKTQALRVLHGMLQQIFNLFSSEGSSATWEEALLDKLLAGLHQQLEDLETCLVQGVGEEPSALETDSTTLALRGYFQGLHLYLEKKNFSDCAWEVVRVEIRKCFLFINKLIRKLRN